MLWERILTSLTGLSLIVLGAVILVKSEKTHSFFIMLDATQKNFKRISFILVFSCVVGGISLLTRGALYTTWGSIFFGFSAFTSLSWSICGLRMRRP